MGYNLTEAQLAAGQARVAAAAAGAVTRHAIRSVAQETTRARDAALQVLTRWMQDFMAIARIALADQPQRLAQLGLARGKSYVLALFCKGSPPPPCIPAPGRCHAQRAPDPKRMPSSTQRLTRMPSSYPRRTIGDRRGMAVVAALMRGEAGS